MNYYKRNLGDFARDTAHLSQGQIGAYDLMLDWYYANERPLPADKADVYRIARAFTSEEKRATDKVLKDFFTATPAGWVQKRADEELSRYAKQRETNRAIGKKGGRPKKQTEQQTEQEPNENRIGYFSETEQEPNNNPNPESSNTVKAKAKQAPLAPPEPVDFRTDVFRRWKALPDGGGGAFLSRLCRDHGEDAALNAADRTMEAERADPKAFAIGILRGASRADDAHDALMARVQ